MVSKQSTNVVYAMLPCRDDFDQAIEVMRSFGEVGGVSVVKNGHGLLEVAYFDVLSAAKAIEELGDVQCWQAAPCGNRIVRLPGHLGLDKTVLDKISDLHADEADPNTYVLEFFDIRDAAHYRELPSKASQPWENQGREPAKVPTPLVEPTHFEVDAEQTKFPELLPGTYAVLVGGLPNGILEDKVVHVMLEQAGLYGDVLSFTMRAGVQTGECVLIVSSEMGMHRCLRHFQGCCYGCHATLINANPAPDTSEAMVPELGDIDEALLMHMEAREDYERGDDWVNHETFGASAAETWSFEEQVAANAKLPEAFGSQKSPPTSEASTEVSESEEDDAKGVCHTEAPARACA